MASRQPRQYTNILHLAEAWHYGCNGTYSSTHSKNIAWFHYIFPRNDSVGGSLLLYISKPSIYFPNFFQKRLFREFCVLEPRILNDAGKQQFD
jgi:hypothetical protein